MALSLQHNLDGTITVTSGEDSLTFLPRGNVVQTVLEEEGATGTAIEDDDPDGPISAGADSNERGGTTPPARPRRPKPHAVGWPLPGSMGFVAGHSHPAKRLPPINLRAYFDPVTKTIAPATDFDAHLKTYRQLNNTGPGEVIPVAIVTKLNESVDLAAIKAQLPILIQAVGSPILPVLTAPRHDEDVF